jgi:hypothetical protein
MRDTKLGRLAVGLAAAGALGLGVSLAAGVVGLDTASVSISGAVAEQVSAVLDTSPVAAVENDYTWS